MLDLPHRFMPTSNKFVSPVRIVAQIGHTQSVTALAFSACKRYLASGDQGGDVKLWLLESLELLGTYRLNHGILSLIWEGNSSALRCFHEAGEELLSLVEHVEDALLVEVAEAPRSGYIAMLDAPVVVREGDSLRIVRGSHETVHALAGLEHWQMDVFERYVVAQSPAAVEVYGVSDGKLLLDLPAIDGDVWVDVFISERGGGVVAVSLEGELWHFDALKAEPRCVFRNASRLTSHCLLGNVLALGDVNGTVTLYDIDALNIDCRIPRAPKSFRCLFPSPDKLGLIAVRDETVSAYLGLSQEILSASPLPAALVAACAGSIYTEVVVACADDAVYRLKLDSNDIEKLCVLTKPCASMAYSQGAILMHCLDGSLMLFDGEKWIDLELSYAEVQALALSEDLLEAAILTPDAVDIIELKAKELVRTVSHGGLVDLSYCKAKTQEKLLLFAVDGSAWTPDNAFKGLIEFTRADAISALRGKLISLAPGQGGAVFVLLEVDHGQIVVLRVNGKNGKSDIVLRLFVASGQIWGATTQEQSVQLRDDASFLRIVVGQKAYSIADWSRSEPLAIF